MTRSRKAAATTGDGTVLALARFAAAAVMGNGASALRALRHARRLRVRRRAAEETALMLVPNAGFPAGLEALRLLNESWPGRASSVAEGTQAQWRRRGLALSRGVYGPVHAKLMLALDTLHPDVARWVIEEGYGRILSRPGLAPAARECIAVSVLTALGWERQTVSHLLGAVRFGVPRTRLRSVWQAGVRQGGTRSRAAATRAWRAAFAPSPRRRPVGWRSAQAADTMRA